MGASNGSPAHSTLAIFGASGDLVSRYILPSLAQLHGSGKLPEGFQVIGLARDEWDDKRFQSHGRKALERHAADAPAKSREFIASVLRYRRADVTKAEEVAAALAGEDGPLVIYLALPPFLFEPVIKVLSQDGLPAGSRVVVEKPFGEDQASARRLNALLHEQFPEDAVFRIDHFLAMETVQNILGLRFANRLFEPVWNCHHVQQVEIVWDETLTMEGRRTYDSVGALRDMVQNHLLQVMTLIAMEPPTTLGPYDLRGRKVDVLRAVRTPHEQEAGRTTQRARYVAGRIGKRNVPDYARERGVDPARMTETFASVTLYIENWRWGGVPFILRSGKALGQVRKEIVVRFQGVPHMAFCSNESIEQNSLRISLGDNTMALGLNTTTPSDDLTLAGMQLEGALAPAKRLPYARLLLDVLHGNPALFIRDDEAEESWRIVDPILAAWAKGRVPLKEYPAGSDGPPVNP